MVIVEWINIQYILDCRRINMTSDISNTKDTVEMNPTEQTPVFIDVDDTAMAE